MRSMFQTAQAMYTTPRALFVFFVLNSLLLSSSIQAAAPADIEELRGPLFTEATAALRKANEARASLLAPTSYSEGGDLYKKAEKTLADGGNLDSIRRDLANATASFSRATQSAAIADAAFGGTIQARQDAVSAESQKYAQTQFREAEEEFFAAASGLERGRKRAAERDAQQALELYRGAELEAIKANYLNETRSLLTQANELKAKRFAPKSLASATDLLAEAERELTENRYDTDRPRNLASQAKHAANHAIYVAKLARQVDDNNLTVEDVLLDWEASIATVAEQVDVPVYFDDGQDSALASITSAIVDLSSERDNLANSFSDSQEQVAALNTQVDDLQRRLGGESLAREEMNTLLQQQETNRQRFTQIEALFTDDQANVLRQGNTVIVRMIGLNFDSGAAKLKAEHEPLLSQLQQAIVQYPGASIVIEGHTDSYGSDALNLELSQKRADSVERFLLDQRVANSKQLTALGYGESKPVANNETPEGRRRNRRIDIVIYPKA